VTSINYWDGFSGIANKTVVKHSNIETYNIAKLQNARSSQTMHNLFVDGDAGIAGKFTAPPGISAMDIA
jgi:hypothetical protein